MARRLQAEFNGDIEEGKYNPPVDNSYAPNDKNENENLSMLDKLKNEKEEKKPDAPPVSNVREARLAALRNKNQENSSLI